MTEQFGSTSKRYFLIFLLSTIILSCVLLFFLNSVRNSVRMNCCITFLLPCSSIWFLSPLVRTQSLAVWVGSCESSSPHPNFYWAFLLDTFCSFLWYSLFLTCSVHLQILGTPWALFCLPLQSGNSVCCRTLGGGRRMAWSAQGLCIRQRRFRWTLL